MRFCKKFLASLLTVAMMLPMFSGVDVFAATAEEDLAQSNGVAYTSSSNYADAQSASAAFDGNDTTYWQAASSSNTTDGAWVAVQFDNVYSVNSVDIDWNSIYATGTSRIEVSTDGSAWTTAASFIATSDADTVNFTSVSAKYVRLHVYGTSSDKNYWPEVLSVSVYGSVTTSPEAVDLNQTNRVSTYANGESKSKENAFDSDASTYWQGNSTSSNWLRVGYDGYYYISSAVIDWNGVYPNGTCTLETSTDGLVWNTVKTFTVSNTDAVTLTFTPVVASYVRLKLNGSSDTSNNGSAKYAPEVATFEVYGTAGAAAPAPDAYTTVSTTDSTKVATLGKTLKENKFGLDGYTFTYGGSGLSVNFVGTELWIYCSGIAEFSSGENFAICVDTDMPMEATMVKVSGEGWYRVASGLEDKQHTITIRKQSRGFGGIMASTWVSLSHVRTDGTILAAMPKNDLIIEVYGDSISNGDATWLNADGSNSAYTAASYSSIVGRLLGADTRVCANTGNGLKAWVMATANLQHDNGIAPQNSWNIFDSQYNSTAWDHSGDNAADVVIINLGTNDRADYNSGDLSCKEFADEYVRFIKQIKTDCPDAIVICALGAMGGMETWGECIQGAGSDYYAYSYTKTDGAVVTGYCEASKLANFKSRVAASTEIDQSTVSFSTAKGHDASVLDQCNEWAGEEFVYFVELEKCNNIGGGLGYDNGHPSNVAQEIYGLQIATLINEKLGLDVDLPAIADSSTTSTGVSKVVAQKSADGTSNRLRLMAAVDGLEHSKVGFRITVTDADGNTYTNELSDRRVYTSVAGVTASDLGLSGGYMFCAVVENVPEDATFTVTAFALDDSRYTLGNGGNPTEVAIAGNFLTVR